MQHDCNIWHGGSLGINRFDTDSPNQLFLETAVDILGRCGLGSSILSTGDKEIHTLWMIVYRPMIAAVVSLWIN